MKKSVLIGGATSSGKTELQKYLINQLVNNERVIIIDTINELDINYNPEVDITCFGKIMNNSGLNNWSTHYFFKVSMRN